MNYYPHHIGDYAQATAHLSLIEDAVYSRLLRRYYAEERPILDDLPTVCRWVGARSKEEQAAVATVLGEYFELDAGHWHNKRADAEIAAYQAKSAKAAKSAAMRWHAEPEANAMRTQCERMPNAMPSQSEGNANHNHNHNQEPEPRTNPLPPPSSGVQGGAAKKPPRPSRRCPPEFQVTDEMRLAMETEGITADLDAETRAFRDHEFAKARSDWGATWRNWIRKSAGNRGARNGKFDVAEDARQAYRRAIAAELAGGAATTPDDEIREPLFRGTVEPADDA